MGPKVDPELAPLKKELDDLIKKCKDDQKKNADVTLEAATGEVAEAPKVRVMTRKFLKGHINKVNCVHYSGDSRHLISGSLDGKLIVWDSWTGNKVQIIPLRSSWVMSVAFAPSGNFVACGGMDNMCTIYDVNTRDPSGTAKITRELMGYEGFLSSCRFVDDNTLVTGSGDMKICIWDVTTGAKKGEETGSHWGDVVSISLNPTDNGTTFVTGSVDKTARLWDVRECKPKQVFFGHEADVNSVHFHPSGFSFGTASEDKTARLFDLRSDQEVYKYTSGNGGFTSCAISVSGRYILCGSDDNNIHIWDLLKGQYNGSVQGHENRVTSLSVAPNGVGLASASWDNNVRVWG